MRKTISYQDKTAFILGNDTKAVAFGASYAWRFLRNCVDNRYLIFFYHSYSAPFLFRFIKVSETDTFESSIKIMKEMVEYELKKTDDPEASAKLKILLNYLTFEANNKD